MTDRDKPELWVLNDNYNYEIEGVQDPFRSNHLQKPKTSQLACKPTEFLPKAYTPFDFSQMNASLTQPSWADNMAVFINKGPSHAAPHVKSKKAKQTTRTESPKTRTMKVVGRSQSPRKLGELLVQSLRETGQPLRSAGFY
jgi:hypothetical protein